MMTSTQYIKKKDHVFRQKLSTFFLTSVQIKIYSQRYFCIAQYKVHFFSEECFGNAVYTAFR